MELLLTHNTALEAFRTIGLRERLSEARPCFDAVPRGAPSLERVSELAGILSRYGFEPTRMEALIGDVACRRRWPHLTTRICKKELPAKSIALLEGGIACVCPEHLAVQMAPLLTELELQVLLCELLGVYAVSPAVPGGMLQVGEPLMTKESLQKHLEELGSFDGVGLVRRALPRVAEGLASPMETRLYLRLTLPLRCGGFGLTVDAVNQPIDVAILGKKGSRKSRRPDFIFKRCDDAENKASAICSGGSFFSTSGGPRFVALEYNGGGHLTRDRQAEDERRTNEILAYGGIEYQLNKDLYDDLPYMEDLVEAISKDTGRSTYRTSAKRKEKHRALRLALKEELDRIDGVEWSGRGRADYRKAALSKLAELGVARDDDLVPVDAYRV